MLAKPYKWVNVLYNKEAAVLPKEDQVDDIDQNSYETVQKIEQLIESLIDLTVDNSDRAMQMTEQFINQVDLERTQSV